MSKDSHVASKTWARSIEPVTKIGYMDGASDGQSAVYQQSFDTGYELGFNFGLDLGHREARNSMKTSRTKLSDVLQDARKINCQVCLNEDIRQQNVGNLYNIQTESNRKIFGKSER